MKLEYSLIPGSVLLSQPSKTMTSRASVVNNASYKDQVILELDEVPTLES
jgi:hypothetical protein